MLEIAICDDDTKFCKVLRQMVQHYLQSVNAESNIEIYCTGEELCTAFGHSRFDLIFLDIELTGMNGVGVGQILRQKTQEVQIVYVSSKEEYAIQLFQNRPFDFLVKPITQKRLDALLDTYFQVFPIADRYFTYTADRRKHQIAVSKILYFESLRKQLRIVTSSQEIMIYAKLSDILSESFSKRLLRIHQSFLVNIQHIAEFRYGEITLTNGTVLPISRSYQDAVRDYLMQKKQEFILRETSI
ncbi:MAG: LytTR family DNA-binding domain-containing protein [Oscillospiraceae bacterium]|nr:LytTR family DNA-binding domain-containing protein [Oscillospiraceae bacterium]